MTTVKCTKCGSAAPVSHRLAATAEGWWILDVHRREGSFYVLLCPTDATVGTLTEILKARTSKVKP